MRRFLAAKLTVLGLVGGAACAAPVDEDGVTTEDPGTIDDPPVTNGVGANEASGVGPGGQSGTGGQGTAGTSGGGGGGAGGSPLTPGLSAFYTFEDSGTTIADDSGNGHDGSIYGTGVTLGQTGKVGNALAFSGLDGRVVVPNSAELEFTKGATIEFWVKLNSLSGGTIMSRVSPSGDGVRVRTADGNIQVFFIRAGAGTAVVSSDAGVLGTTYKHVAIANDGAELKLYVDGKLLKTATGGQLGTVGSDLVLGKSGASDNAFNGSLDELKWWTVSRLHDQICGDAGGTWSSFGCTL